MLLNIHWRLKMGKEQEIREIINKMTEICLSKKENENDYKSAVYRLSFLTGRLLGVLDRKEE